MIHFLVSFLKGDYLIKTFIDVEKGFCSLVFLEITPRVSSQSFPKLIYGLNSLKIPKVISTLILGFQENKI